MRHTYTAILVLAVMALTGCRQERDELVSYSNRVNMANAESSYGEQFKVMWYAMNTYYAAWEIEDIDWDAMYDAYYPRFVELDTLASRLDSDSPDVDDRASEIKDKAEAMYKEILAPLHDGHTALVFIDPLTKEKYMVNPSSIRNESRPDYNDVAKWDLSYYTTATADIRDGDYARMYPLMGRVVMDWLEQEAVILQQVVDEYESTETHTGCETIMQYQCLSMLATIKKLQEDCSEDPSNYNKLAFTFNNTVVPNHPALGYTPLFGGNLPADMMLFITKDNIAYMRIDKFTLSPVMSGEQTGELEMEISDIYRQAWQKWHDSIYRMHSAGTLKGVILDMRNNGGGKTDDFQYVAGAFMAGECVVGTMKAKNGIGRLDYAPAVPYSFQCYSGNTESITAPVVVLTNANSVSMAEMTTIAVKQREGGISIGNTTWGGCTTLIGDGSFNEAMDYAGTFGINGETAVFGYFPYHLCSFTGIGIAESKGFTPDIEIRYDNDLYMQTGRDNQLERAFQYLRTGE
ncbi:MAG: S41 family peptidase [Prevotella sp.]